jgi:class 3 adenylate cyclase
VETTRELGLELRAGVHTGECERSDGKLAGLAVHVGARVLAAAGAGDVVVSGTVRDLVAGSPFEFDDLGERELAGVPGRWRLHRVVP